MKAGRLQRQEKIEKIKEYLEQADSLVVGDYRGLSVAQISEIRRELAKQNAKMHVHRNRLIKIALKYKGYSQDIIDQLQGPNAFVYVHGDVSTVLKTLFSYGKKDYPFEVRGSYIDDSYLDMKQSQALSKLPSRDAMFAIFMGTAQAPLRNFVSGLQEVITSFARTVQALADSKKR